MSWKIGIFSLLFAGAGGFSNGNMFGNFARWNEPNRDNSGGKKVDYKVVGPKAASSMMPAGGPQTLLSKPTGNKLHIQVTSRENIKEEKIY